MELDAFFIPKSVALVGASRTPGKIGYVILESIKSSFKGPIYPINPQATEIAGLIAYPNLTEVKQPIGLVVIAVPGEAVKSVVEEAIKLKIPAAVIISAGFKETGNKEGEEELKRLVKGKIRLLGPNCLGTFCKDLDMLFLPRDRMKRPVDGSIGFITQSGAVGSTIMDDIAFEGVGVSKFASYGNAIDVNELELIDYLGKDLSTRAIAAYLETIHDGVKFIEICKKIVKIKPIVALKAGKTAKGTEAVLSHTGALAAPAEVYAAAFRQAGIVEAKTTEELFDFSKVLASQPPLRDNKIAIITDGGGFGILAADASIQNGLELPELAKETVKALAAHMPEYAIAKNPVDLTGDANSERFAGAIAVVAKDPSIHGMIIIALAQVPNMEESIVDVIRDAKMHGKPIVAVMNGSEYTMKLVRRLESFGVPVYPFAERAAKAMFALREYGKVLDRFAPVHVTKAPERKAEKLIAKKANKAAKKKKS
ncbi:MAG: CoA-binding protein [Candidatus Aenigmatarchaeota archaeon]